jgi:hypothetical protein
MISPSIGASVTRSTVKAQDGHLNEQQFAEIARCDPPRDRKSDSTVIRLPHKGYKPKDIAAMQAISLPTVYGWGQRWQEEGRAGWSNRPKSDRPAKANDAYCRACPGNWGMTLPSGRLHAYASIENKRPGLPAVRRGYVQLNASGAFSKIKPVPAAWKRTSYRLCSASISPMA